MPGGAPTHHHDDDSTDQMAANWERHWQSIAALAIIALLGWNLLTAHQSAVTLAAMRERIDSLSIQLTALSDLAKDRYTAEEAAKDFRIRDERFRDFSARLREIERRFPAITSPERERLPR